MTLTNHREYISLLTKSLFHKSIEIGNNDVLLVIDMQNDFIDRPYYETKRKRRSKGKLATYNAKKIVKPVVKLIKKFKKQGKAKVIASRDYHSGGKGRKQHCSFPIFGEHCVWYTRGSDLAKEIERVLVTKTKRFYKNCSIVYKAFHPQIDSFGAFRYNKAYAIKRVCGCTKQKCPLHLTGSYGIKSNKFIRYPDLAKLKKKKKLVALTTMIPKTTKNRRLFICGILGDYCVLDTAVNARKRGYTVTIVVDLIRNLRIKKDGKILYPTTPKMYSSIARKNGIKFILSKNIKLENQ